MRNAAGHGPGGAVLAVPGRGGPAGRHARQRPHPGGPRCILYYIILYYIILYYIILYMPSLFFNDDDDDDDDDDKETSA